MNSRTTRRFRACLAKLPPEIQRQADEPYAFFLKDPRHPSLHFKKVHETEAVYSVRITLAYRAVGAVVGDEIVWFWIGRHEEYEDLLRGL